MNKLTIEPVEKDIKPTEGAEFSLHLRVTGASPKYKALKIDSSVKNILDEFGITFVHRIDAKDAIIILSGLPVKSGNIDINISVFDSNEEPVLGTYTLNIAPKKNGDTIRIADKIPDGRKGCNYNFDIKLSSENYKEIDFKLTPASLDAINACGLSFSATGVLSGTINKGVSGISAGIEILATRKKNEKVNVTPSNYSLRILNEVTLELDSSYISTKTIEIHDNKASNPVKFASNNASADLEFAVKLLDNNTEVQTKRFTFEKNGAQANYILKDNYSAAEKNSYTIGKTYKLLIIGTDKVNADIGKSYNNVYTWTYGLKVISEEKISLSIKDANLIRVAKNDVHNIYELETGADISIPLEITGGLKPYLNKIEPQDLYHGLAVTVENEVLKIHGTISNDDDAYFTKHKKKTIKLSVEDRDSKASISTSDFIVKLPPVAKNVSEEEVQELVQGGERTIEVDSFNEVSSIDYPDYNTLYPSHVALTENPILQGVTWGSKTMPEYILYTGSMNGRDVIKIMAYTGARRGITIRAEKEAPEGNIRISFMLKNAISNSREKLANIPVKAPLPVASQNLSLEIKHGQTATIDLEKDSHGAPFDAVAISGESLMTIKDVMHGTSFVDNRQGKFILNITPGVEFIGGVESITFYLIKGKYAAKGKVKISITHK